MGGPAAPSLVAPLAYLKQQLGAYYATHTPWLPHRFGAREFGFIFWPKEPGPPPFVRHVGFRRRDDYQAWFARRAPWHAYYSSAYYRSPDERRMVDKGWLGAELVFDLDADHLPRAHEMTFEEQLAAVKVEFQKLLDEFLLGDFGFDPNDMFLTFSGGRGYHAHVTDPKVLSLDARARRQIVDYITGKGISERALIWTETRRHKSGRYEKETKHLHYPRPNEPGWRGRVGRSVLQIVDEVRALPWDEAVARLTRYDGIGPAKAEAFLDRIRDERIVERMRDGAGDQGPAVQAFLSQESVQRGVVDLGEGETDEPVTADVKRLIRLPDSLHGKSGLRVVTLTLDELADFDPLRDAVALPHETTDLVEAQQEVRFELGGEVHRIPENDPVPLPTYAAFFAVARRMAVPV